MTSIDRDLLASAIIVILTCLFGCGQIETTGSNVGASPDPITPIAHPTECICEQNLKYSDDRSMFLERENQGENDDAY